MVKLAMVMNGAGPTAAAGVGMPVLGAGHFSDCALPGVAPNPAALWVSWRESKLMVLADSSTQGVGR